ncbi:MAG: HEAT repeat domain-containing protein, partial [Cyanobacteria bacterium J06635_10]
MDWLIAWGVNNAVGFLFKPVMQKFAEDLGKDVLKDVLKDVVKGLPGNILGRLQKDEINKAVGKAFKEFLEIFQQELLYDLEESEVKKYNQSLKKFLGIDDVKVILGSAFHPDIEIIDTKNLEKIWYEKNLLQLPEGFDWRRLNKPYVRKVKAIIRESDELREIFDSYQLEEIADNTKQIAGIAPDFDLPRYQEALGQKYGYLKLDSLDASGSAYNELKLRSTFIIQNVREFERLIPQALERTKEYQKWLWDNQEEAEFDIQELENYRKFYTEAPIVPVTDIINNRRSRDYTIILGDPGAGKSTLLQFLALNWAESTLSNSFSQPIPILIELRIYVRQFEKDKCKNFLDYLHQAPGAICHLNQLKLDEQLKAGNALVMFDGLDEIFDKAKREDIIADIIRFTDKYPSVQVIVTSRVIGYKPERFRNAEFRHFMLQDFDGEQIQDFINRWHQLAFNDKDDAELKKARLNRALKSSKAIQELAGNPLLLTMMAILSRHRELPRDRSTLYEKAAEVLLQQWDAERYLIDAKIAKFPIDLTDKQAMLRLVAYQMQANEKGLTGNLINGDDLQQIFQGYLEKVGYQKLDARIAAKELINQLRERNFILCHAGDNYYAFVHRTFLEYFCAEAFRRQFEKEKSLSLEELKTEVYGKHWLDVAWHEVLKLIAGALDVKFMGEIIEYLIGIDGEEEKFRNIFLAAGCLGEVRERKSGNIYALDRKLLGIVKGLVSYGLLNIKTKTANENVEEIRILAVSTIAATWNEDPDTLTILKQRAQTDDEWSVRLAAVKELVRDFKDDPDTLLILKQCALTDNDWSVRLMAVQELVRNFKDNPHTLPILKQRALNDSESFVRCAAVVELTDNFKDYPDILPWLKKLALTDDDWYVRGAVVQQLAENFKNDVDTLPWLKQHALIDVHENVRGVVVQQLARNFKNDPDTLPWLKQCIQTDDEWYVRSIAVEVLVRNFKDNPDTLPWLKQFALTDKNLDVRLAAIEELVRNFKDASDTLPWLKQLALTDQNLDVRSAAVEELACNFKDDPDTLPWLKKLATTNAHWSVRRAAVVELARNFKDSRDTLPILKQRAQNDKDRFVRCTVVQELAIGWNNEPGMFEFFNDIAVNDS